MDRLESVVCVFAEQQRQAARVTRKEMAEIARRMEEEARKIVVAAGECDVREGIGDRVTEAGVLAGLCVEYTARQRELNIRLDSIRQLDETVAETPQ